MNGLSCGVIMWAELPFVLSQFTRLSDGQTDGFLAAIPLVALHTVAR